jgi:hypothetical protein
MMKEKIKLKKFLLDHCISVLQKRMSVAQEAMQQAQEAANSEGKSSAGDKYETSRAMGQLDRDMNARQLDEASRDLAFIQSLKHDTLFDSVQPGCIVITNAASFFISLGLGTAEAGGRKYILLSSKAPVALAIEGKKTGDRFIFNGRETIIQEVY